MAYFLQILNINQNPSNMKRYAFIIALIFAFGLNLFSQSYQIESNSLSSRYQKKQFDLSKYKKMANLWKVLLEKYDYPAIPYDSSKKQYSYEFVFEFDSIDKSIIYNRVLEYMVLKYDYLSEILDYQDYSLGKIIFSLNDIGKNKSSHLSTSYFCKYRFTIVDYKMKVEVFNLQYVGGYGEYNTISGLYPITSSRMIEWDKRFQVLNNINADIKQTNLDIYRFIKDYKKDYDF